MKRETIDLFNRIFKVLEPPPDLTLSQWADRYRRLSSESGSKGGKWNTEKAPWQREIMDAITDISVEKVVVMSAAQMGKTDAFLLNTIGYYMHYDPCTILCMQPTLSLAETMSKDRLMPMVRDTPALRDKINEKSRTAGNTIFKKAFPGGRITMTGANSPTELRSRPIRILLADEIDAYPPTAGAEGDPLILAGKRLTTYWNRKEVDTSTPTIKGAIDRNVPVIFDSDAAEARRQMLSGDHAQGIYQKLLVVRIRLSDLEKEPRQGMRMWIGSELYKISEVTTEYNELIIELVGEDE